MFVHGRLQVLRCIGEGGMGTVYEAFDQERATAVALKTLNRVDPAGIYQLKNEFRSLAGVNHENLIHLHELFHDSGSWFFTMDLLNGEPFNRWVRPRGMLDVERLRDALGQLVAGLDAVHAAGKLHRDVKPSNVLVTPSGRLVVLDFGLATDPSPADVATTLTDAALVVGTPAYMAPEQAAGTAATSASDWYAVGVMLFEALTDQLPFTGSLAEILLSKLSSSARPVASLCEGAPADLQQLCDALLARAPDGRPEAALIRQALPRLGAPATARARPVAQAPLPPIIGRQAEFGQLRTGFEQTLRGQPTVMLVSGESGIGKTALCHALLQEVRSRTGALVLQSRCYERESVPFKAFDALVDQLSHYLRSLPARHAASLLPREVFTLARLFPVLGRVEIVAESPHRPIRDPLELQRRAFGAFHELLGRIRDRQPLVVYIDDLHWSDADSEQLLRHLFVDRELTPALFIASHRSDDAVRNPVIQRLTDTLSSNRSLQSRLIRLGPLAVDDARTLAHQLLGSSSSIQSAPAEAIAREGGGNPFLLTELARFAELHAGGEFEAPSLASVLRARVAALPTGAQRLLQALALIGQPVGLETALEAARASRSELDTLRASGLILVHKPDGRTTLECYHDRIRENVASQLSAAEARTHYEYLANAMSSGSGEDPELMCRCHAEAGQHERAAACALQAADAASVALAFEHAANWYRRALTLGSYAQPERLEIEVHLAEALASAGLGADAAVAFQQAASLSESPRSLDLRTRAAYQLLATGKVSEGFKLLQSACSELRIGLPEEPVRAMAAMAWSSLRTRVRGLNAAPSRGLSPEEATRLEITRTAMLGLNAYLPLHAASLASDYLHTALQVGDRRHIIVSLGANASGLTLLNPQSAWARRLAGRMHELLEALPDPDPDLSGLAAMIQAAIAYDRAEFDASREHTRLALLHLRSCIGLGIELDAANLFDQLSASACGDYNYVARTAPPLIDEAFRRERGWFGAMLCGNASMSIWLAADDVQGYRDQLDEAQRYWSPRSPPQWPDYALITAEAMLPLYLGEPERGVRLLEEQRAAYGRSLLVRGTGSRSLRFHINLASCAVSAARAAATHGRTEDSKRLSGVARKAGARLIESGAPAWLGLARVFEAGCAFSEGKTETALAGLRRAVELLEPAGATMYTAAAQRRLGQWLGGDEGAGLISAAEDRLRTQRIVNLDAMTEFLCPGCAPP